MEKYQEVDFFLTEKGWIMGDIKNQDGEVIRSANEPTPTDYLLRTTEKTYKPNTTLNIDSICLKDISKEGSVEEIIAKIEKLNNKYISKKPIVTYIIEEKN